LGFVVAVLQRLLRAVAEGGMGAYAILAVRTSVNLDDIWVHGQRCANHVGGRCRRSFPRWFGPLETVKAVLACYDRKMSRVARPG
jgi:hypothetical protein